MAEFGYEVGCLEKDLRHSELNNATTFYFLLEKQKRM